MRKLCCELLGSYLPLSLATGFWAGMMSVTSAGFSVAARSEIAKP